MVIKRKCVAAISLSLLSLLVLSAIPVYFGGATTTNGDFVEAGDVLRYGVKRFNVDFTAINEAPDIPFEIRDPTILEDSVLYFKILRVDLNDVDFAVGFILGQDAEIFLEPDADWGPDIDPDLLPESIELPRGAGVPFFGGTYNMRHPFPEYMQPEQLPMVLDPDDDWDGLRDELIDNWHPTSSELTDDALTASWQQALASSEAGVEQATLEWNRETGILTKASIKGQQVINREVSEIDIEVVFGYKEHIGLPEAAQEGYSATYILSELDFRHEGIEELAGEQMVAGMEQTISAMEGEPILLIEVTDIEGLFYEFEVTLFPGHPQFEEGPDMGNGLSFGVGLPFMSPDWDFYTSVWATGNLLIDTFTDLVGAVQPTPDMPEFDIARILLDLKVAANDGYHYFGFTLGEEVDLMDPESGATISTETDGDGWLAYEDDGLFAGLYLTMNGYVATTGAPQGDLEISYEFSLKIDREDIGQVPEPTNLEEPRFTAPPSPEELATQQPEETTPGAFIPGFDMIATVAALLGLAVIVIRKKRP